MADSKYDPGESKSTHDMIELSGRMVKVVTGDGETFEIPTEAANMCQTLAVMITGDDDEEDSDDEDQKTLPLPIVRTNPSLPMHDPATLAKVFEFCIYHARHGPMKKVHKPLYTSDMNELVDSFDATFIGQFDVAQLLALGQFAEGYLGCASLGTLVAVKLASIFRDMKATDVERLLDIPEDERLSDADPEVQKIKEKFAWAHKA